MIENSNSPGQNLRAINILFIALFSGVVIFSFVAFAVNKLVGKFFPENSYDKIFLAAAGAIGLTCLLISNMNYNKGILQIAQSNSSLNEKLNSYRARLIAYLALCEGPALFSIICFLLTGNYWFFVVTLSMLIAMFIKRPTKNKVTNDLQLNWQDQQEM